MKKLAFVLLTVVCLVSFMGNAYADKLKNGETVYARSNLRATGGIIYWHNMNSFRGLIPVGAAVKIKGISERFGGIEIIVIDTNEQYGIDCSAKQWDKYFVKDKNEIGLDKLSPDTKDRVMNCEVVNGMTKAEVYASKGCPAYIAWGKTTEKNSLAEVLQSDKWYYMTKRRGHDVMVTFANGVVVKAGEFEK